MTRTLLKTALIASGAALLIAAGPKADLNQDGQVTKAEFTESAQSRFFAMDTDGNNFLSEDERKAHEGDVQKATDAVIGEIESALNSKSAEIMQV